MAMAKVIRLLTTLSKGILFLKRLLPLLVYIFRYLAPYLDTLHPYMGTGIKKLQTIRGPFLAFSFFAFGKRTQG